MTKEQLRRLTDPDSLQEKYMTTPREMKLTDSKRRIYDQEDINVVQDKLRDGERFCCQVQIFSQLKQLGTCSAALCQVAT